MMRRVLTYLLMLAGMLAFFGLFLVIFGNSTEITCAREQGGNPTCRINRLFLGRYPVSSRTVLNITDVVMDETCDDGCSYRAVLVTADGKSVPINPVYTDGGPVREQVQAIAEYLGSGAPEFQMELPLAGWLLALLGGLAAIGLVVLVVTFLAQSRAA